MKTVKFHIVCLVFCCINLFGQTTFTVTPTIKNEKCSKGTISLIVSGGTTPYTYSWSNGGNFSSISNLESGTFSVTITDALANDTILFYEVGKDECLLFPGLVFSPNGDGISDTWSIGNVSIYPDYELQVFNRWGQQVHKQIGPNYIPWDGKQIGLPLPDATYYYILYYEKGKKEIETGSVTIVR